MTQKNTVVIYHANCADGLGAAWACWRKFGEDADYLPCKYGTEFGELMMDYLDSFKSPPTGEDLPKEHYSEQLDVYIVDFSFPKDQILGMAEDCKSISVFDHHESAREELSADIEWPLNVAIRFDMERSGAGLTWDCLFNANEHSNDRPEIINLIEDRDLWRFKFDPRTKGLHKLLVMQTNNFQADKDTLKFMDHLYADKNYLKQGLVEGMACQEYHDSLIASIAQPSAVLHVPFDTQEQGYLASVINAPYFAVSDLGDYLGNDCDVVIAWQVRKDPMKVNVSFRSKNGFDCQDFAKTFWNGGGHKAAAGGWCTMDEWLNFLQQGKLPNVYQSNSS